METLLLHALRLIGMCMTALITSLSQVIALTTTKPQVLPLIFMVLVISFPAKASALFLLIFGIG